MALKASKTHPCLETKGLGWHHSSACVFCVQSYLDYMVHENIWFFLMLNAGDTHLIVHLPVHLGGRALYIYGPHTKYKPGTFSIKVSVFPLPHPPLLVNFCGSGR